ncbi:hypothetical protein LOK49_LG01G00497 [Camellia lanceoleosa]|uniref:Uncharacterized protein n=1 Tax=Camellia lanceoleosa TaxID=1840588 RepID=A0ACC0IWJ3_9ERIC|nr:hypothetical protein LOK49_LG01G00497 [Camellia lanceoleosa]
MVSCMMNLFLHEEGISCCCCSSYHSLFWIYYLQNPCGNFCPSANHFFSRYEFSKRRIQTETEPSEQAVKDVESHEASLTNPTDNDDSAVKFNPASNLKISPNHDLAMIFTCKVCETRSAKTMCHNHMRKVWWWHGGGCNKLHLIADHLGWFGQPGALRTSWLLVGKK